MAAGIDDVARAAGSYAGPVTGSTRRLAGGPPHAVDRIPAPALFFASGLTQYLGAALAIGLFAVMPPATVAWLRLVIAAVVLVLWRRPWRQSWSRHELRVLIEFGVVLAAMNITFYTAIHYLPLGTAVAIEFSGPVAVGAITGRGWRERAAIALAAVGVVLLAGVTLELDRPASGSRGPIAPHPAPGVLAGHEATLGLVAIVLAATFWAGYILIGRRVSQHGSGVTNLAMAMAAGAIVFTPALAWWALPMVTSWSVALAVVGVAVLSSVIPYAIDQVVMRRTSAATFAVLLAMLPATAMIVGVVVLGQIPRTLEVVGLTLVSGAIALTMARRRAVA